MVSGVSLYPISFVANVRPPLSARAVVAMAPVASATATTETCILRIIGGSFRVGVRRSLRECAIPIGRQPVRADVMARPRLRPRVNSGRAGLFREAGAQSLRQGSAATPPALPAIRESIVLPVEYG